MALSTKRNTAIVIACGAAMVFISMGTRQSFGLFQYFRILSVWVSGRSSAQKISFKFPLPEPRGCYFTFSGAADFRLFSNCFRLCYRVFVAGDRSVNQRDCGPDFRRSLFIHPVRHRVFQSSDRQLPGGVAGWACL